MVGVNCLPPSVVVVATEFQLVIMEKGLNGIRVNSQGIPIRDDDLRQEVVLIYRVGLETVIKLIVCGRW